MQSNTLRSFGKLLIPFAVFLILTACGSGGSNQPQITGEQATVLGSDIDALVLKYLEDNNIPGATVAVSKNGRLVLWKGYGWADRENQVAMQPWHRTRIGSVSKVITAIGTLQLVDSGNIALDQPIYSSQIIPLWDGTGATGTPGFITQPDGALDNIGIYLEALAEAPARLNGSGGTPDTGPVFSLYETLDANPLYLTRENNQAQVEEILDWASQIQVWHALSHTAGYLRSGNTAAARGYWNLNENDLLSYAQLHAAMLAGTSVYNVKGSLFRAVPLRFEAGSSWRYSNHGFGLLGLVISEQSGQPYYDYIQDNVFKPLGLTNIVGAYTFTGLDATSYVYDKNGQTVPKTPPAPTLDSNLGIAAGGWAANAYDVARILCGLETRSDISQPLVPERRLLDSATIMTMNKPDFISDSIMKSRKVLGWDRVVDKLSSKYDYVTKNGAIPSVPGSSRVSKYFYPDPMNVDTEINVALLVNVYKKDWSPSESLLNDIAELVEDASIPASYDLFDADYRCVSGPTLVTDN